MKKSFIYNGYKIYLEQTVGGWTFENLSRTVSKVFTDCLRSVGLLRTEKTKGIQSPSTIRVY